MNVKDFLAAEAHKYMLPEHCIDPSEGDLVEVLQENSSVEWLDPDIEHHRWYSVQYVVYGISDKFIKFYTYIITGDDHYEDMGLKYDLKEAHFVEKKQRTIVESYYEAASDGI